MENGMTAHNKYKDLYKINETFAECQIDILQFEEKTNNVLYRNNIVQINQLLAMSDDDLLQLRGFGKTRLNDVNEKLFQFSNSIQYSLLENSNSRGKNNTVNVDYILSKNLNDSSMLLGDKLAIKLKNNYKNVLIADSLLSVRAKNGLHKAKIYTLWDLLNTPLSTFRSIRSLGKKSLHEIIEYLLLVNGYEDNKRNNLESEDIEQEFDFNAYLKRISANTLCSPVKEYLETYNNMLKENNVILDETNSEMTFQQLLEKWYKSADINNIISFVNFWDLDFSQKTSKVINKILNKENKIYIINSRMSGKTLEQTAVKYQITRERVRQIEMKCHKKFIEFLNREYIIPKIITDQHGYSLVTKKQLKKYFGESINTVLFLSIYKDGLKYEKQYEIYSLKGKEEIELLQNFLSRLPKSFTEQELGIVYESSSINKSISFENLITVIQKDFRKESEYFYKTNFNKTDMYVSIIKDYYPNGICLSNKQQLNEFKNLLVDRFVDFKEPPTDRALVAAIQRVTILCGRGTYKIKGDDNIPPNIKNKIERFIKKRKGAVFTNTLFTIFEKDLISCGITNHYYLHGLLKEEFGNQFYFLKDYVSANPEIVTYEQQMIEYILNAGTWVSKKDLKNAFPGINEITIQTAVNSDEIINYFGEYIHFDNLRIYESDKRYFKKVIKNLLTDSEITSSDVIYSHIKEERSDILNRLGINFGFSMFSVLYYLFYESYVFERPYIAKRGTVINRPIDIVKQYLADKETVEIDEIVGLVNSKRGIGQSMLSFLTSLNESHLILNKHELIALTNVGITFNKIECIENDILNQLQGTTKAFRDMSLNFSSYELGVPVSEWLLFSILNKWSKKLDVAAPGRFSEAVPIVSPKGKMNVNAEVFNSSCFLPGDLEDEDFDDLLLEFFEDEMFGDL